MRLPGFSRRTKPVLCFIDDDEDELHRFENAMQSHFTCVTATTLDDCGHKLSESGRKPDLWVLDLYFPAPGISTSRAQIEEMGAKYADLEQRLRDFRSYLASIGQGADGGLDLLRKCPLHARAPVVMFTRKGTLDDAIRCLDAGATAVLKKPMPSALKGSTAEKKAQLDRALVDRTPYLAEQFRHAIRANTFWHKHKGVILFLCGAAVSAAVNRTTAYLLSP